MIAVSAITSYLYCPKKFYMQYVLGLREPAKKPTIEGTIIHEAVDKMQKGLDDATSQVNENTTKADLEINYKKAFYLGLFNSINANEQTLKNLELDKKEVFNNLWEQLSADALKKAAFVFRLVSTHKIYGKELLEKIKESTEVKLESDTLGLRGIADRIEERDETILVYEMKTGKAPAEGMWPNHKIQLAAYMMIAKESNKKNIEGAVEYGESIRRLNLNPFIEDEVKKLVKIAEEIIETRKIPQCQMNENKCKICGLKKYCDYLQR
ncbi:MAG: CRISPR-associated protein Cas4 [archaeon]